MNHEGKKEFVDKKQRGKRISYPNNSRIIISPTSTMSVVGEVSAGALGVLTFDELMGNDIFGEDK
ncbi:hypothetical protein [Ectobacillus sp. sgz5001026]|uniref:hypothetical protein n=1 Tax=Ectobacillus sp. sgz5001026 TaxID=3242473 RepID=UPI0036D42D91